MIEEQITIPAYHSESLQDAYERRKLAWMSTTYRKDGLVVCRIRDAAGKVQNCRSEDDYHAFVDKLMER